MTNEKKQYCSGTNNETFDSCLFDSFEECAKERAEDLNVGDDFYVGESVKIEVGNLFDIDSFIDNIRENAECEVGECAENYLDGEDFTELEQLIVNWFKEKKLEPTFYQVVNEKHLEVTGDGTYEEIPKGKACL